MSTTATPTEVMTPEEITKEARRRVTEPVEKLGRLLEIPPVLDPHLGLALMKAEEALLWITKSGANYDEAEIAVLEELAHRLWMVAGEIRTAVEDVPIYTDEDEEVSQ